MIEGLPAYVSPVFIATTFIAVGFLFYAVKQTGAESFPAKLLLFLTGFWMVFQASLALGGFYQDSSHIPPRIFAFGALPALSTAVFYVLFFRTTLVDRLPLGTLTLLHIVRIPVEITLLWLYQAGQIPQAMTFEGQNFDILSGLSAPIIWYYGLQGGRPRRLLLIGWNILALLLLANIVVIAILAFPSPIQTTAFDQPNRAVMFFPFIWLPAVVVPVVFFSHVVSLYKLVANTDK